MNRYPYNVLIAATGSVAALKLPLLVNTLLQHNNNDSKFYFQIRVIVTEHAKHFFDPNEVVSEAILHDDSAEWETWKGRGDPVLHIELGKWADMLVIAPLDANTLAKMAQGICDNLLTCTTRAWEMSKPLLFCPAMNTRMWQHPITSLQITKLKEWGHIEIPPIEKTLMCGDKGVGAMAEVPNIVEKIISIAEQKFINHRG